MTILFSRATGWDWGTFIVLLTVREAKFVSIVLPSVVSVIVSCTGTTDTCVFITWFDTVKFATDLSSFVIRDASSFTDRLVSDPDIVDNGMTMTFVEDEIESDTLDGAASLDSGSEFIGTILFFLGFFGCFCLGGVGWGIGLLSFFTEELAPSVFSVAIAGAA